MEALAGTSSVFHGSREEKSLLASLNMSDAAAIVLLCHR
jgi:hypothetical protein